MKNFNCQAILLMINSNVSVELKRNMTKISFEKFLSLEIWNVHKVFSHETVNDKLSPTGSPANWLRGIFSQHFCQFQLQGTETNMH